MTNFKGKNFWPAVKKTGGCWEWTGGRNGPGYGIVGFLGKSYLAHRLSYELRFGPIPKGKCVCHKCDNKICVRPSHLFIGTQKENLRDMIRKGRGYWTGAKGHRNVNNKLSKKQVREIRIKYVRGKKSQENIAIEYGVSQVLISCIITRKIWKHI